MRVAPLVSPFLRSRVQTPGSPTALADLHGATGSGVDYADRFSSTIVCKSRLAGLCVQSHGPHPLRASRYNLDRVKSVGITPFRIQLLAFIISGVITGIAGSLYADLNRFVSPSLLSWQMSGELIVFIIIGGVGCIYGPLIGAIFFVTFEQIFGSYTEHWQVFLGLLIIFTVLFARGGLMGVLSRSKTDE